MIYLFLSISFILVGFIVVNNRQKKIQSNSSECSICHQVFSESHIIEADKKPFCHNHLSIYKNSNWITLQEVYSTPTNSSDGVELYENKLKLWTDFKIPSFINSSYEISGDEITTKLTLHVREQDMDAIKKALN